MPPLSTLACLQITTVKSRPAHRLETIRISQCPLQSLQVLAGILHLLLERHGQKLPNLLLHFLTNLLGDLIFGPQLDILSVVYMSSGYSKEQAG